MLLLTLIEVLPWLRFYLTMSSLKLPLTGRGLFALFFAVVLLFWVGLPYADIVASALSVIILSSILTISTISLLSRKRIVEELQVQLSPSEDFFIAGEPRPLTVIVACGTIPFPLKVVISISFTRGLVQLSPLVIKGGASGKSYATPDICFPHRGVWRVVEARATITDFAGMISSSFSIPSLTNSAVTVHPGGASSPQTPPIISSSFREGDTLMSHDTVEGEPYNLKRYNPTDGIRKIVWKVFARSGQLISRHIEPSVTPEGQVLVFAIAGPGDDGVCKTTMSYLLELEHLGLELYFGCEGMDTMPVATNSIDAQELMMDSVWFTEKITGTLSQEVARFLDQCTKRLPASTISKMVFFSSQRRLAEKGCVAYDLPRIRDLLVARGISPVLHLEQYNLQTPSGLTSLLFKKEPFPTFIYAPPPTPGSLKTLKNELSSWSIIEG